MIHIRVKPPGTPSVMEYDHGSGPFDVGRVPAEDEVPRCVVEADPSVSKSHLRLEEQPDGKVRITNTSQRKRIRLSDSELAPNETRVLQPPFTLSVGNTSVTVEWAVSRDGLIESLQTLGASPFLRKKASLAASPPADRVDPAVLAEWFETFISVQRAPVGSQEFYQQTAQALVEHLGMDVGLVLLLQAQGWRVVARAARTNRDFGGREFSTSVLQHIVKVKRTVFRHDELDPSESLAGVVALVAAPVLTSGGEVTGAVYGVRRTVRGSTGGISRLEAQMAQVLATAVGIGLARSEQEEELTRLQVQFRQHFTDQIAQQLALDGGALEGQDRTITVMFADIRGFSRISERLGPPETFRLVSAVLEVLTEAVHRHDGTVMDYVGDELIALWNAPLDQADHAMQAVACATELEGNLIAVNREWASRIGETLSVGVGVNTGLARVGNTGTRYKFKYGALGHTINLASRIQGATRAFGCPILLSRATRACLPVDAQLRRVGRVKVAGIEEAVELFQAMTAGWGVLPEIIEGYERALSQFEAGEIGEAARTLEHVPGLPEDGAVRLLARRVEELLRLGEEEPYTAIIELSSK